VDRYLPFGQMSPIAAFDAYWPLGILMKDAT
jgi:hypothetical protein